MQALWTSDRLALARFECLQPHYNLVHRDEYERELEEVCRVYGLGVIPYSPLAGGFLTGKYEPGQPAPEGTRGSQSGRIKRYLSSENGQRVLEAVRQVADHRRASSSQVALAWLLARPGVTSPIIGPRSIDQLADNLGATRLRLERAEIERLERAAAWDEQAS